MPSRASTATTMPSGNAAGVEPSFHALGRADAPAELDVAREALDDRTHRLAVAAFAGKSAVEIDHVKMAGACFSEDQRLRRGIVAVDGGAVHVALGEADDLAGLQINGGEDDKAHGRHFRKLASRARP
jgi:hypothetical protein